jgi:phage terminase large subunit-like protein
VSKSHGIYSGLVAIVLAAASAVAAVFGLFNSVLAELVPPFDDSRHTVGIVSIGTVAVLLILTILTRKRVTRLQIRTIAAASALCLVGALALYFPFRDETRTYVYRHPPASLAHADQTRHIRGELHEQGRRRVKGMTVAHAVYQLGGPDIVNAMGILWTEASRLQVIGRLERYYVVFTMLLTAAIFIAGMAVWRNQQGGPSKKKG